MSSYCNQCGLELTDNYKFCPKCGAEITLQNKPPENKEDKFIKEESFQSEKPKKKTSTKKAVAMCLGTFFAIMFIGIVVVAMVDAAVSEIDEARSTVNQQGSNTDITHSEAVRTETATIKKISPAYEQAKSANSQYSEVYYVYVENLPSWATDAENVVYDATKAWEDVNPELKFYQVTTPENADFVVQWVKEFAGDHVGYAYGSNFVEVGLGDSNCNGKWQPYSSGYATLIMEHEIGHILGWEHDNNRESIMYPTVLKLQYGTVEEQFRLAKGYAQVVPLCTSKLLTSYDYSVSTSDGKSGFSVHFVPSINELQKWGEGELFSYYPDKACYGQGYKSYSGTCKGVTQQSGLLIIMDDNSSPLSEVNVRLLEK